MRKAALLISLLFVAIVATAADKTITCKDALPAQENQWIAFRRDVNVGKLPKHALAKIAVDSKYWLWVNGEMVIFEGELKRGPNPKDSYYDEVDLAPYLRKGENKIALLLWYFGKSGFSHNDSKCAQMLFECPTLGINTDSNWLCRIHPAFGTADCPRPNYRLSESSIRFDATKDIPDWQTAATIGFSKAVEMESTLGNLVKRPIPYWKDFGIKTAKMETRYGTQSDTVIAYLPHNMQMTPILSVEDETGGHRILIETDHAKVGEECLRADYITRKGQQVHESLGWLNGMKIILTVEHGAKVTSVAYRETGYDTYPEGTFNCNDDFFNLFWKKGLRTIYVNARDNFFDCPERERGQWWGDIVVILGECFYTYSTSLHSLIRKGIHELADWQRPDSILFSPIPGNYGIELPVQMLAAVGKYGIWTYYMNTDDRATIEHVYPAVKRYLDVYSLDDSGIVAFHDGDWNWGDWGDNRDMRLLQNTWYCLALESITNMAKLLGHNDDATYYSQRRETIINALNRTCWTGNGYRHPDYKGMTDDRVQALAVLAGIATSDKYDAIYQVFKTEEHASPYMEKFVMEALFEIGHGDYAIERTHKRFNYIVNHPDFDTLFEGWDVGINNNWDIGSVNHARSGGTLSVLPSKMFGIYPIAAGWKEFAMTPDANIFDDASLSFPTVSGTVGMTHKRSGNTIQWKLQIPKGTKAKVTIPWSFSSLKVNGKKHTGKTIVLSGGNHKVKMNVEQ